MSPEALQDLLGELGQPAFRARQILDWIYRKGVADPAAMTNLALPLREMLGRRLRVGGTVERAVRSEDNATAKYLFRLTDDEAVEAVSMTERGRHTVCLSSQAGCAMGCAFCATAGMGFIRNLTAGEILLQAVTLHRQEAPVNNVVFMGMGEPLLNLDPVLRAVDALVDPRRMGLGTRRITILTCGIAPGIRELAHHTTPVRLALSLNSPFQDQRAELMPVARKHPLAEVLAACGEFVQATGRRVLMEYVLLHGVNTSHDAAEALAEIARDLGGKVNLIEYNPVPGLPFASPERKETHDFRAWLEARGVTVTIRFRRGRTIAAGCGQLATERR